MSFARFVAFLRSPFELWRDDTPAPAPARPPVLHQSLGLMEHYARYSRYSTQMTWRGYELGVDVSDDAEAEPERCVHQLPDVETLGQIIETVWDAVASQELELAREWTENPGLTREDFARALTPTNIAAYGGDAFEVMFDDGDVFGRHAVIGTLDRVTGEVDVALLG